MLRRKLKYLCVLIFLPLLLAVPATAANISQGYRSTQTLAVGSLVATAQQDTVTAATTADRSKLLGIVVAPDDTSVATSSTNDQTQVVTSGVTDAFVTDLNGPVNVGDPITVSPISGIGMKATSAGIIIGIAQGSTTSGAGTSVNVKADDGQQHHATIQSIPINVIVENYSLSSTGGLPLQNLASQVAGRPVSAARLIASLLVLIFAVIITVVVLHAGITNSFTAVGRNPLAKNAINRALMKSIIAAIALVVCSLLFAYILLTA